MLVCPLSLSDRGDGLRALSKPLAVQKKLHRHFKSSAFDELICAVRRCIKRWLRRRFQSVQSGQQEKASRTNEERNTQMSQQTSERTSERANDRTKEQADENQQTNARTNQRTKPMHEKRANQRTNEKTRTNDS